MVYEVFQLKFNWLKICHLLMVVIMEESFINHFFSLFNVHCFQLDNHLMYCWYTKLNEMQISSFVICINLKRLQSDLRIMLVFRFRHSFCILHVKWNSYWLLQSFLLSPLAGAFPFWHEKNVKNKMTNNSFKMHMILYQDRLLKKQTSKNTWHVGFCYGCIY